MNRFRLFSTENVFDFGLLPKIYSAYSCLWSKSIPTCQRWCWESKTPPCENGQNLQSLVSFHMIYESDLLPTGNIRSYDSSYKLAANSQCICYFVLTFKYSYCLTRFSKIYWCFKVGLMHDSPTSHDKMLLLHSKFNGGGKWEKIKNWAAQGPRYGKYLGCCTDGILILGKMRVPLIFSYLEPLYLCNLATWANRKC